MADHPGTFDVVIIWRAAWNDTHLDVVDGMVDPALATTEMIDGIRWQNFSETAVQAHYARIQQTMLAAD